MTIEQEIQAYLESLGMFDSQAKQVVEKMKAGMTEMRNRWSESIDAYPSPMISVLKISSKRYGLEWIEENIPMAWYKPMFQQ